MTTAYSQEVESTLAIMVNKYLASFNEPDYLLVELLSCRSSLLSAPTILRNKTKTDNRMQRQFYNIRSIGYILVDMILSRDAESSFINRRSLIQSMEKTLFLVHDDSLFYALNCLTSMTFRRKSISTNAKESVPMSSSHSLAAGSDSQSFEDHGFVESSAKMLSKLLQSYPFIRYDHEESFVSYACRIDMYSL